MFLGLRTCIPQVRPAPLRKHLCNFIGNLKNHPARQQLANGLLRAKLIDHLKTYSIQGREGGFKCFALFTGDWSNAKQMQPYEYREVVSDSVFTLVPPGMGPSSFRMYEALELGSIPIISDSDHFNLPYGEHPLPLIPDDKWDTLPALFFEMHYKQPERILELQRRVFRWWHVWKRTFLENLACLVERDVMDSPDARKDCLTPAQFAGTSISPSEAVALKGAAQAFLESSKPKPAAKTVRRAPSSSSSSAGVRRAVPIKSARAPSRPPTKTTTAAATTTTNSVRSLAPDSPAPPVHRTRPPPSSFRALAIAHTRTTLAGERSEAEVGAPVRAAKAHRRAPQARRGAKATATQQDARLDGANEQARYAMLVCVVPFCVCVCVFSFVLAARVRAAPPTVRPSVRPSVPPLSSSVRTARSKLQMSAHTSTHTMRNTDLSPPLSPVRALQ